MRNTTISTSSSGSTSKRIKSTRSPVTATQATTATTMVTFSNRRSSPRCVSPSGTSLFANRSRTCDALRFYSLFVLHPHSHPTHPTSHVRPPTTLFCIHPGAGTEKSVLVHPEMGFIPFIFDCGPPSEQRRHGRGVVIKTACPQSSHRPSRASPPTRIPRAGANGASPNRRLLRLARKRTCSSGAPVSRDRRAPAAPS